MKNTELKRLVGDSRRGDEEAFRSLVASTYDELRRIGRSQLRRGRAGLETTVLVHEAFIKLASGQGVEPNDEEHFYAIAARAMRQLVVDEARARATQKRGAGEEPLPLKTSLHLVAGAADDQVLRLHEALERLEKIDRQLARLVELRIFAGLTEAEAATSLEISLRTAQRSWRRAKAWLAMALSEKV